jgi:hypothetical protein
MQYNSVINTLTLILVGVVLLINFLVWRMPTKQPTDDKQQLQRENDSLRLLLNLQPLRERDSLLQNEIDKDTSDISDAVDFFNAKHRSK